MRKVCRGGAGRAVDDDHRRAQQWECATPILRLDRTADLDAKNTANPMDTQCGLALPSGCPTSWKTLIERRIFLLDVANANAEHPVHIPVFGVY